MLNQALVFIKPHAVTPAAVKLIACVLQDKGLELGPAISLEASEIAERQLVDLHYFAIANTAVLTPGAKIEVSDQAAEKFKESFGEVWSKVQKKGKVNNSAEMQERLGLHDGLAFLEHWTKAPQVKLGPGLYVAHLKAEDAYVVNGFYPAMRQRFTAKGAKIICHAVDFAPEKLSWRHFRQDIIGATNPQQANKGSLRRMFLERWQDLGLAQQPSVNLNAVHASAGPVEGWRERSVWLGEPSLESPLAKALLNAGCSQSALESWRNNGMAKIKGKTGPVFDLTEDMDAATAIKCLSAQNNCDAP